MVLENGLVGLPDPSKLIDGWFATSYNLSNTIYEHVPTYLKDTDAGKAFKGGKKLLLSGHIKDGVTLLNKSSDKIHTVSICICKESEAVVNGEYTLHVAG